MLKGLLKLSWIETKVFVREPLGVLGSLVIPVILFVVFGRSLGRGAQGAAALDAAPFNIAILAALFIAIGAVQSLVAIISIYREGGILKRLRATPLSPITILGSHVLVKLAFTVISLGLLVLAGRQLFPGAMAVNVMLFGGALLLSTLSILSLGFVIASLVPTARFAQPMSALLLYPMVAISGLFVPLTAFPPALQTVALAFPTTHAVALMQGVWDGATPSALWPHAAALVAISGVCAVIVVRVFRWE